MSKTAEIHETSRSEQVRIVGNDGMQPLIEALCRAVQHRHPGIEFDLEMHGSSTAFPALASDDCLIAPMSRGPWKSEQASFRSAKGHAAACIHIGYTGHGPRPGAKTPPALYVHAENPLAGLTMSDVARVFSSGHPRGDVNFWHQLSLGGNFAHRRIHLYGLRDDGKYASGFREAHLGGRAYAAHYETLPNRAAVIAAVAEDPYGIGSIGWFDGQDFEGSVRVLGLSRDGSDRFCTPDLADVGAGAYPLSAFLSLYFDPAPNAKPSPVLATFLEIALSEEGQSLVAQHISSHQGYVPLSAEDLALERSRLRAFLAR
ncbi:substrate-binding domain-containing protein [Rhizobium sp. 2MFCol3.1]|uniref:PstS family phosphate ABC transporter substrate-binding protein n=1 Tax=Rhizobium sp. 2MFCol3.1 TaxID=1246459 RepID=UPI00036CDA42|nr:substrate-binding domain-containing protein [Rhizobium sp. 2MFCol3.1]